MGRKPKSPKLMLQSGDWVTAHLDGVSYLERAPLKYWITATLYRVMGISDRVARLPNTIAVILLCLLVYRIGVWAGSERIGFYAGVILATSIGLFLFTRTVIPDAILTLAITTAIWSFVRTIEPEEETSPLWMLLFYFSITCAVLLKDLIALVFPIAICAIYGIIYRKLWTPHIWTKRKRAFIIMYDEDRKHLKDLVGPLI